MTAVDQQQLQLIHQVQQHLLSTNQLFSLYVVMMLPIPVAWRLGLYHWINSIVIPWLPPNTIVLLVIIGPIPALILGYFAVKEIIRLVRKLIPLGFSLAGRKPPPKEMMRLTFPADTGKSAYATEQLYTLLHTLARQKDLWSRLKNQKNEFSLEIVSTKDQGIRYVLAADAKFADTIRRNLLSYLPGIQIKKDSDYLEKYLGPSGEDSYTGLEELKLSSHFALPLESQKTLKEHDPISYLTGNMTQLIPGELVSFQVVVTPLLSSTHGNQVKAMQQLKTRMYKGEPLTPVLENGIFQSLESIPVVSAIWAIVKIIGMITWGILSFVMEGISTMFHDSIRTLPYIRPYPQPNPRGILNPYEQELSKVVKAKIDQQLFEASIRLLVVSKSKDKVRAKLNGLLASFGQLSSTYQSLSTKSGLFSPRLKEQLGWFKSRNLSSSNGFHENPVLSASELSDLFHFPFTDTTKTEDMAKVHSSELPAPLSVKNNSNFDVVFGKNTYGNSDILIGLTDDDRSRHVYIIGQTGSGKSTIMYHMAHDDIQKDRGVAIIDPHGDLAEDLLNCVPKSRLNDCIYFNPFDIKYPIGINLLELTSGLDEDELEQEKELVCESVVSIFRRVFTKDENADAHRIEYILRNAIYTAFTIPEATIFTVYELLNNPKFQKSITNNLSDENLKNFWKNEFGRAGNYQVVKMVSGVTAKVGRFLFSPTAKRILEQPKSTINFDNILSTGKILICNLAEGKLGEDTSQLLGTTIIAKIQLAAMRRVRNAKAQRTPFYVFIDEFQNFATSSFAKLLSGGRKFGLRLTLAEQSTSQQDDRNLVNVILANTGTVICFRTASPVDEQLMLAQFGSYVTQEDIVNLPRFKFFIKMSAIEPEEPFSGTTLPVTLEPDPGRFNELIEASRKNFAIQYKNLAKGAQAVKNKTTNPKLEPKKYEDVGTLSV